MSLADMSKQAVRFYTKLYEPLVGSEIVGVRVKPNSDGGYDPEITLRVKLPMTLLLPSDLRGKTVDVEVWQDEEGNGPGTLVVPWDVSA